MLNSLAAINLYENFSQICLNLYKVEERSSLLFSSIIYSKSQQIFSVKSKIVHSLGIVGHIIFIATIEFSSSRVA